MSATAKFPCGCSIARSMGIDDSDKITDLRICPKHLCGLLNCRDLNEVAERLREVLFDA